MTTTSVGIDPVTVAVLRNGLDAVTRKVDAAFERAGMHPLIYEAHDFGVALFDEKLNLLAIGNEFVQAAALRETMTGILDVVGRDQLAPGDIVITSLPSLHGVHPPDVVIVGPAFASGHLVGFCVLCEHVGDVGGASALPTQTTEVFGEGLLIPPVKLYDRGVLNDAICEILSANSRTAHMVIGNLLGGVAAVRRGCTALLALIAKHGLEAYYATITELLDHGERMMRDAIALIPDGVYRAEGALDDNGVQIGVPVPISLTISISGSDATFDTTGSAAEQPAPVNCHLPLTRAAIFMAMRMFTGSQAPPNSGEHRPLKVIAPSNTIFNPSPRAASFWASRSAIRLTELIVPALADALPDRLPAGRSSDLGSSHALLRDPETGQWVSSFYVGGAGGGAIRGADGPNAVYFHTERLRSVPMEVLEMRDPTRRLRFELDQDSGGPGRWRGGLGMINEQEYLSSGRGFIACFMCGGAQSIRGTTGGQGPKTLGGVRFYPDTDREIAPPNGRVSDLRIEPGDRYISTTAGGGGVGDPLDRDVDSVAWDVLNEYVSCEAAIRDYGVVFTTTNEIDRERTQQNRENLRKARRGEIAPGSTEDDH